MITDKTCSVCLQTLQDVCLTDCNHEFCKNCLDSWFDSNHLSCPLCRKTIQYFKHKDHMNRIVCVTKQINRIRNVNREPFTYISKKMYYIVGAITSVSLISNLLLGYLYSHCKHFSLG